MEKPLITLVPYTSTWALDFEKEKNLLQKQIGKWCAAIEHIGSTAIAGILAKPIIDIMIGVYSLSDADQYCIMPITNMGYAYIQEYEAFTPERRFFYKAKNETQRTHNIHLVELDSSWWERHLLFRDYLRSHPEIAKKYEELKIKLSNLYLDTNDYAGAKTPFIREIENQARKEKQ